VTSNGEHYLAPKKTAAFVEIQNVNKLVRYFCQSLIFAILVLARLLENLQ